MTTGGIAAEACSRTNIVRHDRDPFEALGREVIVDRRGQYYREFFADSSWRKIWTLIAAQACRDKMLASLPPLLVKSATHEPPQVLSAPGLSGTRKRRADPTYVVAHWHGGTASSDASVGDTARSRCRRR